MSQYVSEVKSGNSGNKHMRERCSVSCKANLGLGSRSASSFQTLPVEACPLPPLDQWFPCPSYQSTWGSAERNGSGTLQGFTE